MLAWCGMGPHPTRTAHRLAALCILSGGIAVLGAIAAGGLIQLIALVTQVCWHGRWSGVPTEPDPAARGWWTMVIPVLGGLVVGLMARFGAPGIRGHGIPEAMEQTLTNQSQIPPRLVILKPLSAAIAIGTGGPFGAEGPIIATGGAMGSLLGQCLRVRASERRTLLAAGAAAGMAAIFGTPIAAVLLVVELLLFEWHARSFIPVAIAATLAAALRPLVVSDLPAFPVHAVTTLGWSGVAMCIPFGCIAGAAGALVTRTVYGIEDAFAATRLHWCWWPACGGIAVGIAGICCPSAIGIGYGNITDLADGTLVGTTALGLLFWKSLAWSLALGSGTSGGTLAPVLTIGGCLGALLAPILHLPVASGVLVGMAAVFAGVSHAVLASAVFVAEATGHLDIAGPAILASAVAWLVASRLAGVSIMVEKIRRRGIAVPGHQGDPLPRDAEHLEPPTVRWPDRLRGWRRR